MRERNALSKQRNRKRLSRKKENTIPVRKFVYFGIQGVEPIGLVEKLRKNEKVYSLGGTFR
jgi:hypothetical protein